MRRSQCLWKSLCTVTYRVNYDHDHQRKETELDLSWGGENSHGQLSSVIQTYRSKQNPQRLLIISSMSISLACIKVNSSYVGRPTRQESSPLGPVATTQLLSTQQFACCRGLVTAAQLPPHSSRYLSSSPSKTLPSRVPGPALSHPLCLLACFLYFF